MGLMERFFKPKKQEAPPIEPPKSPEQPPAKFFTGDKAYNDSGCIGTVLRVMGNEVHIQSDVDREKFYRVNLNEARTKAEQDGIDEQRKQETIKRIEALGRAPRTADVPPEEMAMETGMFDAREMARQNDQGLHTATGKVEIVEGPSDQESRSASRTYQREIEHQAGEDEGEIIEALDGDNEPNAVGLEFGAEPLPQKATEVLAALDNHPTVTEAQVPPERKSWARRHWTTLAAAGVGLALVMAFAGERIMQHFHGAEPSGKPEASKIVEATPQPDFQGVVDTAKAAATPVAETAKTPEASTVHIAGDAKGAIHSIKAELQEKGYQADDMELGQIATRIAKAAMGENWNNLTPQGWNGNLNEITSALSNPADIAAVNLLVEKPTTAPTINADGAAIPATEVAKSSTPISWLPDAPVTAGISDTDPDIYFPDKLNKETPRFSVLDDEEPFQFDQVATAKRKVEVSGKTGDMERSVHVSEIEFQLQAAGFTDQQFTPQDKQDALNILAGHAAELKGRGSLQAIRAVTNTFPELQEITRRPLERAVKSTEAALLNGSLPLEEDLAKYDSNTSLLGVPVIESLPNLSNLDVMYAMTQLANQTPNPDGTYANAQITSTLRNALMSGSRLNKYKAGEALKVLGSERYDQLGAALKPIIQEAFAKAESKRRQQIISGQNNESQIRGVESNHEAATAADPWIFPESPVNPMWSTQEQAPSNAAANLNVPADPNNPWSVEEPPTGGGPTTSHNSIKASQR